MNTNMVCTFCRNKGIPMPHNHTVRNWTLPDKPVICPVLLNTECTYCKIKGHTRQYCPIRNIVKKNNTDDSNVDDCSMNDCSMNDSNLKRLNNNCNNKVNAKHQKLS